MNLFELSSNWKNLYELDSEDMEVFNALLQVDEAIEEKAVNIAYVVKKLEGDAETIKKEVDRLSALRKTNENKQKRLKEYLWQNMAYLGMEKIDTPLFKFAIQNSAPSLKITDTSKIPLRFQKLEPVIDKAAIKESLKNGEEVEGARLIQGKHLRIR